MVFLTNAIAESLEKFNLRTVMTRVGPKLDPPTTYPKLKVTQYEPDESATRS
jgi:hypothetical protein